MEFQGREESSVQLVSKAPKGSPVHPVQMVLREAPVPLGLLGTQVLQVSRGCLERGASRVLLGPRVTGERSVRKAQKELPEMTVHGEPRAL